MRIRRLLPVLALAGAFAGWNGVARGDSPAYQIYDLGTLGGSASAANAINDAGQIAGDSFVVNNDAIHGFLYSGGSMQDLDTLSGDSHAFGINSLGQAVGYSTTSTGNDHAVLYNGGVQDLGTLGGPASHAYGINTIGTIVGDADLASGSTHAFVRTAANGTLTDIGTLGGDFSSASAINELGHVVGLAYVNSTDDHAFIWTATGGMKDLGILPSTTDSEAYAVNLKDQVVGTSENVGSPAHGFLYSNGVMQDVGTLGGDTAPAGINDLGQVVGASYLADGVTQDAFLYDSNGIHDLNKLIDATSGWQLQNANAINNEGDIVGAGFINGDQHAFLLVPTTPVPEPASALTLVVFASIGLLARRASAKTA